MKFPTISALLLFPLLAAANTSSTTTLTSTATLTRTITVSQVVANVTSTYPTHNSTSTVGPTAVWTPAYTTSAITTSPAATTTHPSNFMGAASSLNSMYAGSAGMIVMIAAALL